jgi:threonine/homoserine/homoserine lactone efflux protein
MATSHLLSFILASLVMVAIPGPDQALITRNALVGGSAAARRTMLGGASGLTVHASAAALGVSALLATSATAYTTLKLVGIAYLIYLAVRMFRSNGVSDDDGHTRTAGSGPRHPFAQGLLSNALNPKVALFFLTFLPQFLPNHGATLPTALGLSAVFAVIYLAWFSALIRLVERLGEALRSPRIQRRLERITGGALLAFAVRLAFSARG